MNAYFEKDYMIDSRDTDLFGLCRPSALLGYFQDLATRHVQSMGVDRAVLMAQYNSFWMLVRVRYTLIRPLRASQMLRIRTNHRGTAGAAIYRDFDLWADGEPVGTAVSQWVIANSDTRVMFRPSKVPALVATPVPEELRTTKLTHLKLPERMQPVGERRVQYSDTDLNGHMNNNRYLDIACDAAACETMDGLYLSEAQVNYTKECFAGQTILLSLGRDGVATYVRGADAEDKTHFEAELRFSRL